MMAHALASTTLTDFQSVSGHFTRCWDFRSAFRVNNSIVVVVPIYSIPDLYANSLQRFTLRKWSCVLLFLQFLHRVNDRVRKMQDQSSKDATQDSNKHSEIW